MNEENKEPMTAEEEEAPPYETYGWEFHKGPLLYAVILTVVFYAFIFFYLYLP